MESLIQKLRAYSFVVAFLLLPMFAPLASGQVTYANATNYCANGSLACHVAAGGDCLNVNNCDLVNNYLNPFINFMSAVVGLGAVISIVIGGIQYSSSGGEPAKASAAKARIRDSIIGLIAFFLLYALLNFLIPGGLL